MDHNNQMSVTSAPHRFKDGRQRPYSLALGRRIKQKLWERLDRPTMTSSVSGDGLVRVEASYGVGVYPSLYDVDTLGEPQPRTPSAKRAKTRNMILIVLQDEISKYCDFK